MSVGTYSVRRSLDLYVVRFDGEVDIPGYGTSGTLRLDNLAVVDTITSLFRKLGYAEVQ